MGQGLGIGEPGRRVELPRDAPQGGGITGRTGRTGVAGARGGGGRKPGGVQWGGETMSRKAFAASDAEWAYHGGELVRMGEIRLSPATHALNYGTGVFEGIRAYWSEERGTLQVLKLREHYERFEKSCRLLRIDLPLGVDELCDTTLEILRRNAPRVDTYVRPLAFKAVESVGVNLTGESELSIFTVPMGNYVELTGLKVCVSSWRRTPDNAIPARAKCTGSYVNTALAVDEAHRAGYDDAIFLTQD